MINIGIDARLTYYRTGGTSTYIRSLLTALQASDQRNRYTILRSRKSDETLVERFKHVNLWTPAHHKIERLALSVELARLRLDVLHSPDFIPPIRGARKHVITVHDLAFLLFPHHMTDDSKSYYNDQIQMAVNHADHILAVSEATKHDIMRLLKVPEEKITVQLHGVSSEFRPYSTDETAPIRAQYQLPEDFMLFVGTIEPRKNIDNLLNAYEIVRSKNADTPPLVIIGNEGWLAGDTIKHIHNTKNVIWLDALDYEKLPAFYAMASCLILPAFYEGFGLPVLEAMACGTIPIVSDVSSLPEVAGEVGLRMYPDDVDSIVSAIEQFLGADSDWITQQQQFALARASQFTWQKSASVAQSVYEMVAQQ